MKDLIGKPRIVYAVFILATLGLGLASGLTNIPDGWYSALNKPFFNPPNWIFGPVWTVLYILIGVAGARLFLIKPRSDAMAIWFAQLALNLCWSPSFFGHHSIGPALGIILVLLLLLVIFIRMTLPIDRIAALLFAPYVLWVGFASLLNLSLFILNW
ncbi:tryptophan-rich sensory protein [Allorhizobium sp. BGMRC 0089]|uniref:TspO/MBR family protein n=1 Tax=Allorhizobium sonneratiae TaxID=2934936 RepID=UPI002033AAC0|nr:TspO/MBR family protein [Allorhizobium sonneratiae]MCM2291624.1 tryptophan-rich sensory protein [Allorhizobium sonneratiae]